MKQIGELISGTEELILDCPIHGQYNGWRMPIPGVGIVDSQCDKCAAEESAIEAKRIADQIAAAQKHALEAAKIDDSAIPKRFRGKSFKDYQTRSDAALHVRNRMVQFVKEFDTALEDGTSFLFTGTSGTGKTHLACAVANNLLRLNKTATYASSLNLISKIKQSWITGSTVSEDEIVESYVTPDFFVLDELGKGTLTEKERGMIFRVIDRRYEDCKPTIGISNLQPQALAKLIDTETVRRLGTVVQFNWEPFA